MALNVVALVAGIILLTFGGNVNPLVFNAIIVVAVAIIAIMSLMIILGFKQQWTLKVINLVANLVRKITFGKYKTEKLKEEARLKKIEAMKNVDPYGEEDWDN